MPRPRQPDRRAVTEISPTLMHVGPDRYRVVRSSRRGRAYPTRQESVRTRTGCARRPASAHPSRPRRAPARRARRGPVGVEFPVAGRAAGSAASSPAGALGRRRSWPPVRFGARRSGPRGLVRRARRSQRLGLGTLASRRHPAAPGAITLRHAASSVAPGRTSPALPASLPGLVLAPRLHQYRRKAHE